MEGMYRKKDILRLPHKYEFIKELKSFANKYHHSLDNLTEEQISDVLSLLSWYCYDEGNKALAKIYKNNLLQMVQYEDGDCGHRFEMWGL